MSVFRGTGDSSRGYSERAAPVAAAHDGERRVAHTGRMASGTIACRRCDAPVALTAGPVAATETLTCPFCGHRAPARDFLSLATPTRPARVEVRAVYGAR
jgi:hypothetical protein